MTDPKAVVQALCRLGFKENQIEVHTEAQHLYGYQGDQRAQKAHIIIRRQFVGGASNDIGFEKTSNGSYRAIISEYDRNHHNYNDTWLCKLGTYYGVEKTKAEFKTRGIKYTEDVDEKNRPRLRARI